MRRLTVLTLGLFLALASPALADRFELDEPAPYTPGQPATLTGHVYVEGSTTPVPGRPVYVRGNPEGVNGAAPQLGQGTTDGQGAFTIQITIDGAYSVQAGNGASDYGNTVTVRPATGGPAPAPAPAGAITLAAITNVVWPAKTTLTGTAPAGAAVAVEVTPFPYTAGYTTLGEVTAGEDGTWAAGLTLDRRTRVRARLVSTGELSAPQLAGVVALPRTADIKPIQRRTRIQLRFTILGPPALEPGRTSLYFGLRSQKLIRRVAIVKPRRIGPGRYAAVTSVPFLDRFSDRDVQAQACWSVGEAWRAIPGGTAEVPADAAKGVRFGTCTKRVPTF